MRNFFRFGRAAKADEEKVDEGAPKAEGDALAENMKEVTDFGVLLDSLEECGGALQEALTKLQTAPTPLLDCLGQSYSKESAGGELLQTLGNQLNACIYHTTLGVPHLEEMMARVRAVKPRVGGAKEAFQRREGAWGNKVRCDKDAGALKQKPGGGRPTFTIEERRARLKAKSDADEEFKNISEEVWRQCNEILYNRWSNTAAVLTDLGHCYAAIFEAPPKLANELLQSVAKLSMSVKVSEEPPEEEDEDEDNNVANSAEDLDYLPTPSFVDAGPGADGLPSQGGPPVPLGTSTSQASAPAPPPPALSVASTMRGAGRGAPAPPGHTKALGGQPPLTSNLDVPPGSAPPTGSVASGASGASRVSGASRASGPPPPGASRRHSGNGVPPTQSTNTAASAKQSQVTFRAGELVQVWSSSSHAWLDGVVKEVFTHDTTHDIYSVPAGVIKVESAAGIKFIQPEQVSKLLRKQFARTDTMGTPSRPTATGQL